jgi:uncharacterized SAM-binding protein YcdF (DUF218 family)
MRAGCEDSRSDVPDAVVVLGAQVLPGGRPSTALRRRVVTGVAALRRTGAPAIVMCGGVGATPPAEAAVMAQIAEGLGVAADGILLEDRSHSTLEQAEQVAVMAGNRGWRQIIVVTDRYHLPRAVFLFRKTGLQVRGSGSGRGDGSLLRWWGGALREIPAWVKTAALALVGRPASPRRRGGG